MNIFNIYKLFKKMLDENKYLVSLFDGKVVRVVDTNDFLKCEIFKSKTGDFTFVEFARMKDGGHKPINYIIITESNISYILGKYR